MDRRYNRSITSGLRARSGALRSRDRNNLITFQKRRLDFEGDVPLDDYGDEAETWRDLFSEYAAVYYGSGGEQRAAAQTQGEQAASFEVLNNTSTREVTIGDYRIKFGGGYWNIRAKADIDFNAGLKFTAIREVP